MKWNWWWGYGDVKSEPLEFFNFGEMKLFSSRHSACTKHLVEGYWSDYKPV